MPSPSRGTQILLLLLAVAAAAVLAIKISGPGFQPSEPGSDSAGSAFQPAADQSAPVLPGQELKVLSLTPQGPVNRVQQITAAFNQPMVALGDYAATGETASIMAIEPPLPGVFRWLNQYTLAFVPARELVGAQTVRVTVRAGTASLTGAKLAADQKASFSLPPIALLFTEPAVWSSLPPRPELRLAFNQPIKADSLREKLTFRYERQGETRRVKAEAVPLKLADGRPVKDERLKASSRFMIRPEADLPPAAEFKVLIEAGLRSAAGPEPSPEAIAVPGETYKPLTVTGLDFFGYYRYSQAASADDRHNPEGSVRLILNNYVKYGDLLKAVAINNDYDLSRIHLSDQYGLYYDGYDDDEPGEPLKDEEGNTLENRLVKNLILPGPFKPDTLYEISVSPQLTDIYGQRLGDSENPNNTLFYKTGPFEPLLDVGGSAGILETKSPPVIPVLNRGLKSIEVKGLAVPPSEAADFIRKHGLYEGYYDLPSESWAPRPADPGVRTMSLAPSANSDKGAKIAPLYLNRLFNPEELGPNLLYLDISSPEFLNYNGEVIHLIRQVQISDLGLSAKLGQTSSLILVTDIATGQPWPEAAVTIRNISNQVVWEGRTDEQGLARAPGFGELAGGRRRYETELYIFAQARNQTSMITTAWDDGLEPWQWDLNYRPVGSENQAANWLISALPIYKPGEEVKLKLINRQIKGDVYIKPAAGESVRIQVKDSFGEEAASGEAEVTEFGTVSFGFALSDQARLGQYAVLLNGQHEGSFLVENYRKPSFQIAFEPLKAAYTLGQPVDVQLRANYHFGLPVSERPVKYTVTREKSAYSLPGWEGYTLDSRQWEDYSRLDDSDLVTIVAKDEAVLDASGRFGLTFATTPGPAPGPQSYNAEFTVTDVDARTVSDRQRVLVHPADFYVALKTMNYVGPVGQPLATSFLVASPAGELKAGVKTTFTVYRRNWQTVRRKSLGSVYEFESNRIDDQITQQEEISGDSPATFEFTPEKAGYYLIKAEVTDERGRANQAVTAFYAYGADPVGWPESNTDRLDLIIDKPEYKPGDTARIMVKSPFEQGLGLLTLERAGVRSARVFPITDNTPVLEVPLDEADAPNVFVSVLLVRGRVSERLDEKGFDFGKPTMRLGYGEIKVRSDLYRYQVEAIPDKAQTGPGEEINVDFKVTDHQGQPVKAELAVVAADAAVIQLAGESGYYPENFYARDLPLIMLTLDSRLKLIGRRNYAEKGAAPASGGGVFGHGDGVRRDFAALAFFDPAVVTDEEGRARVTMKMPESLTTFNIYAVATGPERESGTGKSSVLVTKDLLIQSALPNYLGVDDEFTAMLTVHNRGASEGRAQVTLKGEGFALREGQGAEQSIQVAAGSSQEVGFKVRAGSGPRAAFTFEVVMGRERDAAQFVVPVSPANRLTTQASYERVTAGTPKVLDLKLPAGTDPSRGGLTLDLAPSLLSGLSEPFDWLVSYSRGCVEQRTSKALGSLVWLGLKGRIKDNPERDEQARAYIQEHLRNLRRWNYDGAYSYWPNQGGHHANPYVTAFVMEFLLAADQAGFEAAKPLLENSADYLSRIVKNQDWPSWYSQEDRRGASIYLLAVLSRAGRNIASLAENYYLERQSLTTDDLANLLLALTFQAETRAGRRRINDLTDLVSNRLSFTAGDVQIMNDRVQPNLWWSKERTTSRIILALAKVQPDHVHLASLARWLIAGQRHSGGHFGSTHSNALALLALTEYLKTAEPEAPQLTLEAVLGSEIITRASFESFAAPMAESFVPTAEMAGLEAPQLKIDSAGQGQIWATARLKTAPREPDLSADTSGGFVLSRSYRKVAPAEGPEGQTTFRRGDVVRVTVTMMVPADRHWVVLEDRIPAGFEPINFNLLDAQASLRRLLTSSGSESGEADEYDEYDRGQGPAALNWYDHQEIWPDRVAVYSRYLPEGVFSYSYLARAVTIGRYLTPGAMAEEMYAPETYGRSSGQAIMVAE